MLNTQTLDGVAPSASVLAPPASVSTSVGTPAYDIDVVREPNACRARLEEAFASGTATPFQSPSWLATWYAAVGAAQGAEPLVVFVTERGTGRAVVTLPLIRRMAGGLQVVNFADLGITDYNAPILGPAAPVSRKGARAMWAAVLEALPEGDLIELRKMPGTVCGRPNPMALLRGVHPSHSPGFSVALPDDWDAYLQSLSKKFRKELRRSSRLFEKEGNATLRRVETLDEASRILEAMNIQQRARLKEMGYVCALEEDEYHAFYAELVAAGLEGGTTVLTALMCGDEVVAVLLGIADGTSFTMVRLSHAGGDWMRIGPGRLIIGRTLEALHAQGCRYFDFSIGDYPYKSGFGVKPSPLHDLVAARSWRGRFHATRDLAKAMIKQGLGAFGVSLVPKAVKGRYRRFRRSP